MKIEINEDVYTLANEILEDEGMEFNYAVNMFLKKIIKEKSIGFLFVKNNNCNIESNSISQDINMREIVNVNKMTKNIAKRLFSEKGYQISANYVFASENKSTHIFWANFHYSILSQDLNLILNDITNKMLYLLFIPANTINANDLVMRADKPEIVDLQIAYNDPTFTDNRSGISFSKHIIETINY